MTTKPPATTRCIVVQESKENPKQYDAALIERPLPAPQPGQVVVKIAAAGFNHKDVLGFWFSLHSSLTQNARSGSVRACTLASRPAQSSEATAQVRPANRLPIHYSTPTHPRTRHRDCIGHPRRPTSEYTRLLDSNKGLGARPTGS